MPDHVHLLVRFGAGVDMSKVLKSFKSYLARQHGIAWQDGFFEHRIRNDAELAEKADYMLKNPVVWNLCEKPEEWIFKFGDEEYGGDFGGAGRAALPKGSSNE